MPYSGGDVAVDWYCVTLSSVCRQLDDMGVEYDVNRVIYTLNGLVLDLLGGVFEDKKD